MTYSDFYDIAEYLNEINRNVFTAKEVACYAADYYADFLWSKENEEIAYNLKELAKILGDDDSDECHDWLYEITKELDLFDTDDFDYGETNASLAERIVENFEEHKLPVVFKIETVEGVQKFFMYATPNSSIEKQIHNALAKICFCDAYDILAYDNAPSWYVKDRDRLCREYQQHFSEFVENAFPSGIYTSLEAIKEDIEWRLSQSSPKM